MSVPDRRLLTSSVLTLIATGTARPTGDGKAPAIDLALTASWPYAVVHVITGGGYWGSPLTRPDECADFVYQVDSVARRRDQAEWMADLVRRTVLARTSTGAFQVALANPAGWEVKDREADGGAGTVVAEGDPPNTVFSLSERFRFRVVPA